MFSGGNPVPVVHLNDVMEDMSPIIYGRVPLEVDGGLAVLEHLWRIGLVWLTRLGEEGHSVARPAPQFLRLDHGMDSHMVFFARPEVSESVLHGSAAEDGPVLSIQDLVTKQHLILQVRDRLLQLRLVFPGWW